MWPLESVTLKSARLFHSISKILLSRFRNQERKEELNSQFLVSNKLFGLIKIMWSFSSSLEVSHIGYKRCIQGEMTSSVLTPHNWLRHRELNRKSNNLLPNQSLDEDDLCPMEEKIKEIEDLKLKKIKMLELAHESFETVRQCDVSLYCWWWRHHQHHLCLRVMTYTRKSGLLNTCLAKSVKSRKSRWRHHYVITKKQLIDYIIDQQSKPRWWWRHWCRWWRHF